MPDPKQQLKDLAKDASKIVPIEGQKGIPDDLFTPSTQTQAKTSDTGPGKGNTPSTSQGTGK